MSHVKAKRLDLAVGIDSRKTLAVIDAREQQTLINQGLTLRQRVTDFIRLPGSRQLADDRLRRLILKPGNNLVDQVVHHVDAAAVYIQHQVIAIQFKLMNHKEEASPDPTVSGEVIVKSYLCKF